ncbi:MAG: hypothetical protein ACR2PL_05075, partial [Dehalococcoidia bacterium]
LSHGHPNAGVRQVVERVLRPISRTVREVGKASSWSGVLGQIDRYLVELMEGRTAVGEAETALLIGPLHALFWPASARAREEFDSYVRFCCTLLSPTLDDVPDMLASHRYLLTVKALGLPEPAYAHLVETVIGLRSLGRYLAEAPLSDETDGPDRTDVAAALKGMPRRHAAVHRQDRTVTIRTRDIARKRPDACLVAAIRTRSRAVYCGEAGEDGETVFFDTPPAAVTSAPKPFPKPTQWPA